MLKKKKRKRKRKLNRAGDKLRHQTEGYIYFATVFIIIASCRLDAAFGSDLRINLTENKPLEFASSESNLSS